MFFCPRARGGGGALRDKIFPPPKRLSCRAVVNGPFPAPLPQVNAPSVAKWRIWTVAAAAALALFLAVPAVLAVLLFAAGALGAGPVPG